MLFSSFLGEFGTQEITGNIPILHQNQQMQIYHTALSVPLSPKHTTLCTQNQCCDRQHEMPANHLQLQSCSLKKRTKNEEINNVMSFSASSCTNQDSNKKQIGKIFGTMKRLISCDRGNRSL